MTKYLTGSDLREERLICLTVEGSSAMGQEHAGSQDLLLPQEAESGPGSGVSQARTPQILALVITSSSEVPPPQGSNTFQNMATSWASSLWGQFTFETQQDLINGGTFPSRAQGQEALSWAALRDQWPRRELHFFLCIPSDFPFSALV